MPQFDPAVAVPQIAWLIAVFALLYLIVRAALPSVERVVTSRSAVIGDDLDRAEAAKVSASAVMTGYEAALAAARAGAAKLAADAKAATSAETAARLKGVEADLAASTAVATTRIEIARMAAVASLRSVAADATADIVERLTGRRPDAAEASAATDQAAATVAA